MLWIKTTTMYLFYNLWVASLGFGLVQLGGFLLIWLGSFLYLWSPAGWLGGSVSQLRAGAMRELGHISVIVQQTIPGSFTQGLVGGFQQQQVKTSSHR